MTNANATNLRGAYEAARIAVQAKRLDEALQLLDSAINSFSGVEGDRPPLVQPLVLMADVIHRLGRVEEAHSIEERALTIAKEAKHDTTSSLADALCLVALAEWNNGCVLSATSAYEQGIAEGERVGATNEWLTYHLTGIAELIVDIGGEPHAALAHATRAVELTKRTGGEARQAVFAKLALGKAQFCAGLNALAEETFQDLLQMRLATDGDQPAAEDKMVTELRNWIAKSRGA